MARLVRGEKISDDRQINRCGEQRFAFHAFTSVWRERSASKDRYRSLR